MASPCGTGILFSLPLFPLFSAPRHFVSSPPFLLPPPPLLSSWHCASPLLMDIDQRKTDERSCTHAHKHIQGRFMFFFFFFYSEIQPVRRRRLLMDVNLTITCNSTRGITVMIQPQLSKNTTNSVHTP